MSLDRGTKIYAGVLLAIAAALVVAWLLDHDWRAAELTTALQEDPEIAAYPFPFRVVSVRGGTATVTSPRSAEVSVLRFLAIVHPELAGRDPDSPEVIAAQKALARVQGRVRKRLLAEPDVQRVRWRLDRAWFQNHGVTLTP